MPTREQWENTGMGMIPGAAGAILGIAMQGANDRRQIRQQQKLQDMQMKGNKEMTDYQKMKELEMWKATSYPAQMAMMKQAGLNPALMYGQGGGGGVTVGGGGAGVSGGQAPSGGGEVFGGMGMGIQMRAQTELLQAQKENIQANTEKTKGETGNLGKVGANIEASTASLTQGIQNAKAQERLTLVQEQIAETENEIKGQTKEDVVRLVNQEVQMADQEILKMERENLVDAATAKDRIQMVKTRLAGAVLENLLTQAKISLTKEEIWAVAKRIGLMQEGQYWEGLRTGEQGRAGEHNRNMNDVSESEKVPIEIIEKAVQAVGVGAGMREAGRQQGRNQERYERFKDFQKTREVFR